MAGSLHRNRSADMRSCLRTGRGKNGACWGQNQGEYQGKEVVDLTAAMHSQTYPALFYVPCSALLGLVAAILLW